MTLLASLQCGIHFGHSRTAANLRAKFLQYIDECLHSTLYIILRCAPVANGSSTSTACSCTTPRKSSFLFFRGTFYRWAQLWPEVCANLRDAPKVLAVGDLHVGSFGTWRDTEGRLSWGIDDFDESYPLPYTNDLVRLAASVKIVIDSENLTIRFKEGCSAILEGYQKALKAGGCPFVLAEHEKNLERLGVEAFEAPDGFGRS
jgi:hypothetical protein